jgi:hypothetical protein
MLRRLCATAVLTLLLGWSASASASTVNCPGTAATTDREFTLDTAVAATCYQYGTGNLNGSGDFINGLGWVTLDKSDDTTTGNHDGWLSITGQGTTSGTFTINPLAWSTYGSILFALKAGEGQLDPDWAVFTLAFGTLTGNWSISGSQSLSHANLYGGGSPTIPTPEPTSMVLLGTGLIGVAARMRRTLIRS